MNNTLRSLRMLGALALALTLSGCGGGAMYWYNAKKDLMTTKTDKFQCEETAAAYSRNMGEAGNKDIVNKRIKDCMEIRGYVFITESELPEGAPKIK